MNEAVQWIGPMPLEVVLRRSADPSFGLPPAEPSVYLVTRGSWDQSPGDASDPLYVGGITGRSCRFRDRFGQLVARLCGLFTTGNHSGGESLHRFCREHGIDPLTLQVAWVDRPACHRCLEGQLYEELHPRLNKKRPPACPTHGGGDRPARRPTV